MDTITYTRDAPSPRLRFGDAERYAPDFVRVKVNGKRYSIPNLELLRVYIRLSHMIAELEGV